MHSRKAVALAASAFGIVATASAALAVNLTATGGHTSGSRAVLATHGASTVRYQDVYDTPTAGAPSQTSTSVEASSTGEATQGGPPSASLEPQQEPGTTTGTPAVHDDPTPTTIAGQPAVSGDDGDDDGAEMTTTTAAPGVTTTTVPCVTTTSTTMAHSEDSGEDHHRCPSTSVEEGGGHD